MTKYGLQLMETRKIILRIRILLAKRHCSSSGRLFIYAFQILLSENRINDEKGFQIKSELTKLI